MQGLVFVPGMWKYWIFDDSAGSRVRTGTYGQNTGAMTEYVFYVKKKDYERAMRLM